MKELNERIEHAKKIRDAALRILGVDAPITSIKGADIGVHKRDLEGLTLSVWGKSSLKRLMTMDGRDFASGLEIQEGKIKVFCILWDPESRWSDPEYLMFIKPGPWIEIVTRLGGIK